MKTSRLLLSGALISSILTGLSSCVVTETIEPENPADATEKIVLNLSTPEDVATRATDGFKLRYVARLYNGSKTNLNASAYSARQELIEGETGLAGVRNQMVFEVPSNQNYVIFVFADYIPVDSQPTDGLYADYYYDTKGAGATGITMLGTPANTKTENVTAGFFNNDNYDCFAGSKDVGYKSEQRIDIDLKLERIVAKVKAVDTSGLGGKYDIDVTAVTYLKAYDLSNETGYSAAKSSGTFNVASKLEFPENTDQEVLYFYTFANKTTVAPEYPALTFNITDPDKDTSGGTPKTTTVKADNITVLKNNITVLKGKFLQGLFPDLTPDEPAYDPTKGYIYVDLSVSEEDWTTSDTDWSKP